VGQNITRRREWATVEVTVWRGERVDRGNGGGEGGAWVCYNQKDNSQKIESRREKDTTTENNMPGLLL